MSADPFLRCVAFYTETGDILMRHDNLNRTRHQFIRVASGDPNASYSLFGTE